MSFGQNSTHHWESVVLADLTWKYFVGTVESDSNWRKVSFNDAGWEEGAGGIGYGDDDDNTVIDSTLSLYSMHIPFYCIPQRVFHISYIYEHAHS